MTMDATCEDVIRKTSTHRERLLLAEIDRLRVELVTTRSQLRGVGEELDALSSAADAHRCGEGVCGIVGASPAHEYATVRPREEAIVRSTIEWFREGVDTEAEIAHVVAEVLGREDVIARIMAGKPAPVRVISPHACAPDVAPCDGCVERNRAAT